MSFDTCGSLDFIPFSQSEVISLLDAVETPELSMINMRYQGLCEIICNLGLIHDFIGKGNDSNYLKDRITILNLNNKTVIQSHILEVYSKFQLFLAFIAGIYPDNIFSYFDQWSLVSQDRKINREILGREFQTLQDGEVLKLEIFRKNYLEFYGHSLLVKKISVDSYILFDPNFGEYRNLSFENFCNNIDFLITIYNGTSLLFLPGKKYLCHLDEMGVLHDSFIPQFA